MKISVFLLASVVSGLASAGLYAHDKPDQHPSKIYLDEVSYTLECVNGKCLNLGWWRKKSMNIHVGCQIMCKRHAGVIPSFQKLVFNGSERAPKRATVIAAGTYQGQLCDGVSGVNKTLADRVNFECRVLDVIEWKKFKLNPTTYFLPSSTKSRKGSVEVTRHNLNTDFCANLEKMGTASPFHKLNFTAEACDPESRDAQLQLRFEWSPKEG